jgi:DNA-binding transcriptional ArsR family regulator
LKCFPLFCSPNRNFTGQQYRIALIQIPNFFSLFTDFMKPLHTRVEAQQLDRAAAMLKVLSHPKRLAIVDLLGKVKGKDQQLSVTDIYQALELPQAIASQHLITLKDRGVLKSTKVGTKIYYSLAVPQLLKVIDTLEDYSGKLQ